MISKKKYPYINDKLLLYFRTKFPKTQTLKNFLNLRPQDMEFEIRMYYRDAKIKILQRMNSSIIRIDQVFLYEEKKKIYSGSTRIDDILYNGFSIGRVCEIYGESGSGKTQICLTTSLLFASSGQGSVLYFTSRGTKLDERIRSMYIANEKNPSFCTISHDDFEEDGEVITIERPRKDVKETLKDIHFEPLCDINEFWGKMEEVRKRINGRKSNFFDRLGIVVVDSLCSLLSPTNKFMENDSTNNLKQSVMNQLKRLTTDFGITVLITNFATQRNQNRPFLGHEWAIMQCYSLGLFCKCDYRSGKFFRTARIGAGVTPHYEKTIQFHIDDKGVCDPPLYPGMVEEEDRVEDSQKQFEEASQFTIGAEDDESDDEDEDDEDEEEYTQ